ncbi:MAG: hypothetical protein P4L50_09025 [Anaerolineaceae bacterium]|nr:hypothetical protein [Anaerolineaceae bacterium]
MLKRLWHALDPLFPEQEIFTRRLPLKVTIPTFVILAVAFSFIGSLIPANRFIAFDWVHFFGIQRVPPFYPPWTLLTVRYLTYPVLIGITLAAFFIASFQRSVHPISFILTFLTLPVLWTIFLGQLEGLVVLGMLGLPWLIPLVLVKPQISIFGLGARRSYILAFFILMVISVIIWGNWPATTLSAESFYQEGRYVQNIGLGWYGLPLFLLTIWFSRGDMDMLMACGAFISPHVIFYNLLPLTPAMARLRPRAAVLALFLSYLTLSSNWLGPYGWWLGWGFVPWIWINLAAQRYPNVKASQLLKRIVG